MTARLRRLPGGDDRPLLPGERWLRCQAGCGYEFTATRSDAKYCSGECRQWAYRSDGGKISVTIELDYGDNMILTAIAELDGVDRQQVLRNSLYMHLAARWPDPVEGMI